MFSQENNTLYFQMCLERPGLMVEKLTFMLLRHVQRNTVVEVTETQTHEQETVCSA